MYKKIWLTSLFSAFIIISTQAQKLTRSQLTACNAHFEFINKADKVLYDLILQLEDLYEYSQNYKKHGRYGAAHLLNFRAEVPEYYLQKAQKERTQLGPLKNSEFTKSYDACVAEFKSIIQDCRDIEIYLKLKDYEYDGFAYADSMLNAVRLKFERHAKNNARLSDFMTDYVLKNYGSSGNAYLQAAELMLKRMRHEKKLISKLYFNIDDSTPTNGIPFDDLIKNYMYSYENEFPDFSHLKHPLSFYYRQFTSSHSFTGKAYMLDEATRKELRNDGHANFIARNSINYYNHDLLMSYNRFAESMPALGQNLPDMPRLTPVFKIDSTAKAYPPYAYFGKYKNDASLMPPQLTEGKKLSPKQIQSYSACTDFINREIRRSNQFAEMLTRRNASLNRYAEGKSKYGPGTFSDLSDFGFAHSEFYKALAMTHYLDAAQGEYTKQLLLQLRLLAGEREQLMIDLYDLSKNKSYQNDKGKTEYALLKRAEFLYKEFFRLEETFRTFSNEAALAGEKTGTGPWYISARSLKQPVEAGRKVIKALEAKADSTELPFPSVNEMRKRSRETLSAFYDNMDGLDKFGRYHGMCPYSPYEDICTETSELAAKIHGMTQDSAKAADFADNLYSYIRRYNDIAEEYNRFARLAEGGYEEFRSHNTPPAYILKTTKYPYSFRFNPPEDQPPLPDETNEPENFTLEGYAENNLVLLPDVSSSMNDSLRWPLLKVTFERLLRIMRPEDYVSVVSFAGKAEVVLQPTSCQDKDYIIETLHGIRTGGSTSVNKGVELALKTAESNYLPEGNNRIILATDGQFKLSDKNLKRIAKASDKVRFTVFLFSDNPEDLERVREIAEKGRGNLYQITPDSIQQVLLKELQAIQKQTNE